MVRVIHRNIQYINCSAVCNLCLPSCDHHASTKLTCDCYQDSFKEREMVLHYLTPSKPAPLNDGVLSCERSLPKQLTPHSDIGAKFAEFFIDPGPCVYTLHSVQYETNKNVPALPFSVTERVNKHAHCISWKWTALFHSLTCLGRYVCCVRFVVLSFFMPLKCLGRVILSTNMCAVENCGSISRVMRRHSCVQLEKGALLRMVYTADWRTSAKCLAPSSIFDKNELLSLYPLQR